MSFGKRSAPTLPSPTPRKTSAAYYVSVGIVLVTLALSTYLNRHAGAALVMPGLLDRMELAEKPISGGWNTRLEDPEQGDVLTYRMLTHMMRICGNVQAWARARGEAAPSVANRLDAEPSVYGDSSISIGQRAKELEARSAEFCAAEQHIAVHDGRIADKGYIERELRAIETERVIMEQAFHDLGNTISGDTPDSALTETQIMTRRCYEAGKKELLDCVVATMVMRGKLHPAVMSDMKVRLANKAKLRQSMAR